MLISAAYQAAAGQPQRASQLVHRPAPPSHLPHPSAPEHHQPVEQAVVVISLEAGALPRPRLVQPLCTAVARVGRRQLHLFRRWPEQRTSSATARLQPASSPRCRAGPPPSLRSSAGPTHTAANLARHLSYFACSAPQVGMQRVKAQGPCPSSCPCRTVGVPPSDNTHAHTITPPTLPSARPAAHPP